MRACRLSVVRAGHLDAAGSFDEFHLEAGVNRVARADNAGDEGVRWERTPTSNGARSAPTGARKGPCGLADRIGRYLIVGARSECRSATGASMLRLRTTTTKMKGSNMDKRVMLTLGAALVVFLLVVTASSASNRWFAGGLWVHHHTKTYTYSGIDQGQGLKTQAENARQEWAGDTNLSLPTSSHSSSRIHLIDDYYGKTGWSGVAYSSHHASHSHVKYNKTYISSWGTDKKRAIACQEIGHVLGLGHGGGDCMAFTYFSNWSPYVLSHSINEINWAYAGSH